MMVKSDFWEEPGMTDMEQRAAARKFAAYWATRGDEKQETARFWIDLLQNVYGVKDASKYHVSKTD